MKELPCFTLSCNGYSLFQLREFCSQLCTRHVTLDLALRIPEQSCNTWYYEYFEKRAKYKNCNNSYSLLQTVHLTLFVRRMNKFLNFNRIQKFFYKMRRSTIWENWMKKIQLCQFSINSSIIQFQKQKVCYFLF